MPTPHTEAAEPAGWRANHIEETIRSIARLHAEHHQNATPLQRAVDRITALLGRPRAGWEARSRWCRHDFPPLTRYFRP